MDSTFSPYPSSDSILIAEVPVNNRRFRYSFALTPEVGRRFDGSPGKIGPGLWNLVIRSDALTEKVILILPSEIPEPRAVLYDRGRI